MPSTPGAEVAEGFFRALFGEAKEGARKAVQLLRDHRVAFVGNPDTIRFIRQQRKRPEVELFRKYVPDRSTLVQIELGIALRDLQVAPSGDNRMQQLRDSIFNVHGKRGLWIAQLAELEILTFMLTTAIESSSSDVDVQHKFMEYLAAIEQVVIFVKATDDVDTVTRTVRTRLESFGPGMMVLFARGKAVAVLQPIVRRLTKGVFSYQVRSVNRGDSVVTMVFSPTAWDQFQKHSTPASK